MSIRFMKKLNIFVMAVLGLTARLALAEPKPMPAQAISDGAVVRQDANDQSATIATLKKGEAVTALDRKGGYWKVKLTDGREGFMSVTTLITKGSAKDLVGAATAPAPGSQAAKEPGAIDKAKANANSKIDALKPKKDDKSKSESKSQKLEKAANSLLK